MNVFIALCIGWVIGAICGGTAYMIVYHRNANVGTPSASHNRQIMPCSCGGKRLPICTVYKCQWCGGETRGG